MPPVHTFPSCPFRQYFISFLFLKKTTCEREKDEIQQGQRHPFYFIKKNLMLLAVRNPLLSGGPVMAPQELPDLDMNL
ncbi:hypothetical protein OUZ56_002590 [Daphnia magna]|uniref:Uncharacterized protein n=1 Tax=Daphnia magna TaxID=35525 RepID=A0ABR0A677_9CRUS|nr:hypothetical protein OUZ56_002590 [Daphnia magna]